MCALNSRLINCPASSNAAHSLLSDLVAELGRIEGIRSVDGRSGIASVCVSLLGVITHVLSDLVRTSRPHNSVRPTEDLADLLQIPPYDRREFSAICGRYAGLVSHGHRSMFLVPSFQFFGAPPFAKVPPPS